MKTTDDMVNEMKAKVFEFEGEWVCQFPINAGTGVRSSSMTNDKDRDIAIAKAYVFWVENYRDNYSWLE